MRKFELGRKNLEPGLISAHDNSKISKVSIICILCIFKIDNVRKKKKYNYIYVRRERDHGTIWIQFIADGLLMGELTYVDRPMIENNEKSFMSMSAPL